MFARSRLLTLVAFVAAIVTLGSARTGPYRGDDNAVMLAESQESWPPIITPERSIRQAQ